MHKDEAGKLFASLGDPNRVKIVKMLYHNTTLNLEQLEERMGLSIVELKAHIQVLIDAGLILKNETAYECNREVVDTLMAFIPTKCSCC